MSKIIIIGIGNPFRGDDGAGPAVIDALLGKLPMEITLSKQRGDISELIDCFASYPSVYIVDACSSSAAPGTCHRIDGLNEPLPAETQVSTHGMTIRQAITLARTLDKLPSKLIVYAISGNQYHMSNTLSPPVANTIDSVVQNILNEEDIRSCMKNMS
jgi:hydrogenase maturation protease